MTKQKTTKKALLVSVFSLVLSVSMLVGSTFAWFTDSARTGVTIIKSGKLDVMLEMSYDGGKTWEDAEGKPLEFRDVDGNAAVLWEPGSEFKLPQFRVRNNGNLAFKFKIIISELTGDIKLADVLDVNLAVNGGAKTTVGTLKEIMVMNDSEIDGMVHGTLTSGAISAAYEVSLRMQDKISNDYQDLTLEGLCITVYAAQTTEELDSYGNQYDNNAMYDVTDVWDGTVGTLSEDLLINSAREFAAFAASVNGGETYEGKTVTLNLNIDLDKRQWTPIKNFAGTFDGQGYTILNLKDASLFGTVFETGVVKNVNLKDVSANAPIGGFLANTLNGKAEYCSVKNAVVNSTTTGSSGFVGYMNSSGIINYCSVDGFTLTVTNTGDNRDKVGGLVGQSNGATITNSTVSNITLNGVYKTKEWGGFVGRVVNDGIVEACTATNVTINISDYAQSVGGFVGALANATIKNCDANGVTIEINNGGHVGGFCGYTGQANFYDFDDCHVTGLSITLETDTVVGIGGFSGRAAFTTTIKNCSAEGTINASENAIAGGNIKALVGQEYDGGSVYENNTTNVTIQ